MPSKWAIKTRLHSPYPRLPGLFSAMRAQVQNPRLCTDPHPPPAKCCWFHGKLSCLWVDIGTRNPANWECHLILTSDMNFGDLAQVLDRWGECGPQWMMSLTPSYTERKDALSRALPGVPSVNILVLQAFPGLFTRLLDLLVLCPKLPFSVCVFFRGCCSAASSRSPWDRGLNCHMQLTSQSPENEQDLLQFLLKWHWICNTSICKYSLQYWTLKFTNMIYPTMYL